MIDHNETTILITFMNDLPFTIQTLQKFSQKNILINTEHIHVYGPEYHSLFSLLQSPKYFVWDFSPTNIRTFNQKHPELKTYYLPLLYNPFLKNYYESQITRKTREIESKQIDILFFGTINERRQLILDQLKSKYNVKIVTVEDRFTNSQLFDIIENSKLILNMYYYEVYTFDYYRSALLLTNNVNVIFETPRNIDTSIEKNLVDWENILIHTDYDHLVEKIDEVLQKPYQELQDHVKKANEWFSKNDMTTYIIDFFTTFTTLHNVSNIFP
jgi:hypothetical protein